MVRSLSLSLSLEVLTGLTCLTADERKCGHSQIALLALPLRVGGVEDDVELVVGRQFGDSEVNIPRILALAVHLGLVGLVDLSGDVGDAKLGGGEELQVDLLAEAAIIARPADQHQHTGGLVGQPALLRSIRGSCGDWSVKNNNIHS